METKQSKITFLILGLIVIFTLVVTLYIVRQNKNEVKPETRQIFTGSNSDTPTYTDLQGNKISLEDWLGQTLVVVSWASWSPFSADNFRLLETLAKEYDSKNIKFIAMNRKESKEQALRYLSTLEEFPHITLVIDTEDLFYTSVNGYAMPETVIFDTKGEVVLHERGVVSADLIKQTIDSVLNK